MATMLTASGGFGKRARSKLKALLRERSGGSALQFAILAPMFFVVVFATMETVASFAAEQVLVNANDKIARKIRMGEITFNTGQPTDVKDETAFRAKFCEELTIMMTCSLQEIDIPSRLFLDVRSAPSFADLPANTVPRTGDPETGPLDTTKLKFSPGGKSAINIVRAYYRWPVILDFMRPYLANLQAPDGSLSDYLLVATAVIQNEAYQ
jgi:Flp pilus assembly protein TadG